MIMWELCPRCDQDIADTEWHRNSWTTPSAVVDICADCAQDLDEDWKLAYGTGWKVARSRNPEGVVMVTLTHRTMMLSDDGTRVLDDPYTDGFPTVEEYGDQWEAMMQRRMADVPEWTI